MEPVKFLLVDDRAENLLSLESLLRRDNLILLKAQSGSEALELLLKHDVALALVDVQMPEMDGFELAEMMRGTQRTKHIPIIFVTASNSDQVRRFRGYETGAVDFIHKPVEASALKSKANVFYDLYVQRQEVAYQRDQLALASAENKRLLDETREYARALQEADHRKDEFLATLSHELRNPLAPLRSGLEILQGDPSPEIREKIYKTMDRELEHMVCLINDLLDISRVSKGKINLQKKPVSLHEAVQMALESSEEIIRARDHDVTLEADEKVWVEADPTRLVQIIANLVHNAAKYTPFKGKIRVAVKSQDGRAVVSVADSGVGIPADKLAHIFELFTQLEASARGSDGGLGIGLSLAKQLVDLHGGEILAESEGPGCGSTFTVALPAIEAAAPKKESCSAQAKPADIQPLCILVVDDNIAAAETMSMMLEMEGHDVSFAPDGEQALALARKVVPDAVLLDIGLPDISGYDVARELRSDPRFDNTLLVAQTGWGQQRDKDAAKEAGFDHHFVKPVKLESIVSLLQSKQRASSLAS
ncbi:response regulator [Proteobacteria bacterium 005FR1]|nr:response regulator [Proteobacteria bacterium 005FR1]